MALNPTKIADRGSRNSTSTGNATVTLTNPEQITPGNYLIARIGVDNSGGGGALPGVTVTDSQGHAWDEGTGALFDPGAASAGMACYLAYVLVTTAYAAGNTVTFTWGGSAPRSAIVIEEWKGLHVTTPVAVARVTAGNISSTAQPAVARTATAANQLMYVAAALEGISTSWGAQDTDTTNGSWSDVTKDQANTGSAATSVSVYGGYKVVSASGAQTWNNTLGVTSDWAAIGVIFAPGQTQDVDGALTPAGALTTASVFGRTYDGELEPAGALTATLSLTRSHDGELEPTGELSKLIIKGLAGAITGAGGFAPTDITGCIVWLDPDDTATLTLSGDQITLWEDKSGTGNDFIPIVGGVGADYTPNTLNGKAVALWPAANTGFRRDALDLPQPLTIFLVIYFTSMYPSAASSVFVTNNFGSPAGSGIGYHPVNGGSMIQDNGTGGVYPNNTFEIDEDTPYYMTFVYDGASSFARLNGVTQFAVNVGTNDFSGGFTIGRQNGGADGLGEYMPGSYIAHFIVYDTALASGDYEDVEAYLDDRFFGSGGAGGISGALTAELIEGGETTDQGVDGALTPVGALDPLTLKALTGALTPAGQLDAFTSRTLTSAVTPTGALDLLVSRTLTGSVTPTAALDPTLSYSRATDGALTPVGALDQLTLKALTSTVGPSGALTKVQAKALASSVTLAGAAARQLLRGLSGANTPAGSLDELISRRLTGASTPTGALTKSLSRALASSSASSGAARKQLARGISGAVASAGQLDALITEPLTGNIGPSGTVAKLLVRALTGAITLAGAVITQQSGGNVTDQGASGTLPSSGALDTEPLKALSGASTPTGALTKVIPRAFTAAVAPSGAVAMSGFSRSCAGQLELQGSCSRNLTRGISSSSASSGSCRRTAVLPPEGALVPTGSLIAALVEAPTVFPVTGGTTEVTYRTHRIRTGSRRRTIIEADPR